MKLIVVILFVFLCLHSVFGVPVANFYYYYEDVDCEGDVDDDIYFTTGYCYEGDGDNVIAHCAGVTASLSYNCNSDCSSCDDTFVWTSADDQECVDVSDYNSGDGLTFYECVDVQPLHCLFFVNNTNCDTSNQDSIFDFDEYYVGCTEFYTTGKGTPNSDSASTTDEDGNGSYEAYYCDDVDDCTFNGLSCGGPPYDLYLECTDITDDFFSKRDVERGINADTIHIGCALYGVGSSSLLWNFSIWNMFVSFF